MPSCEVNCKVNYELDNYINYLIDKYFIFDKRVELDESNCIVDSRDLMKKVDVNTKVKYSDTKFIELTKTILDKFLCFKISISFSLQDRLMLTKSDEIYLHYKKYKNSQNCKARETETYLKYDHNIDTSKTVYVDSLDKYSSKQLCAIYGDPLKTGKQGDNHRYEYKFELTTGGKIYIFSLYDYLNEDNEFYKFSDIYWHIASNTDKKDIIKEFMDSLSIEMETDHDNTNDCC